MQTLRVMRRLANAGVRDPLTVNAAAAIVQSANGYQPLQASTLRGWLDLVTQFQADPVGVETIRTVPEMLGALQRNGVILGDCDDVAVLAAAMGKAAGLPARFKVLGFQPYPRPFKHVFTELHDGASWREMDVTRPPFPVPHPARVHVINV